MLLQPFHHAFQIVDSMAQGSVAFLKLCASGSLCIEGISEFCNDELSQRISGALSALTRLRVKIFREVAIHIGFVGQVQ